MSSTRKPSLPLRIATLTLAAGALTALVVQASVSTGCNGSRTTTIPSAVPEPAAPQGAQPAANPPASPAAPAAANPERALKPGTEHFPATKAAPVFDSQDVAKELAPMAPVQQKAPAAQPESPALKPGADHFPATKSGFVFDPKQHGAPQAPAAQKNASPQQSLPPQGTNR